MDALWEAAYLYFLNSSFATALFHQEVTLTSVEYSVVQAAGTIQGGQVQRFYGTNLGGTGPVTGTGPAGADFAKSFAVTLDAGGARRGRYGRFFPPPQNLSLVGGRASVASATDALARASKWVNDINAALNGPAGLSTAAQVVASGIGSGSNRNVAELRVGRVPDHQSRRRRGVAEAYVTTGFPAA